MQFITQTRYNCFVNYGNFGYVTISLEDNRNFIHYNRINLLLHIHIVR